MTGGLTAKKLAGMTGSSEKTAREMLKVTQCMGKICDALTPEQDIKFGNICGDLTRDKKNGVSIKQWRALSELEPQTIRETIAAIIAEPGRAREIINRALPSGNNVKIAVTLPADVSEYYTEQAKKRGISKTKYLEKLLTLLARSDDE